MLSGSDITAVEQFVIYLTSSIAAFLTNAPLCLCQCEILIVR